MNDSLADRERLASELRRLRGEAALSTTELAKRLGWSQSKVSRTELGRTLAKPREVDAWAMATGADSALRDELVRIAERSAAEFTEWRRELAPGRRRVQEEIQRLEGNVSVTRVFAPNIVVGLAQTGPYAEAVFGLGRPAVPAEELDEIVQARLARQAVLVDQSKRFILLMGETALRRRLIPPSAMRSQLDRLVELVRRPNITVGVIPFHAAERVHQYHGFAVLGDPKVDDESIVLATSVTRAINIRSPDEIAEYIAHFEALRSAALEGERLRVFLREVLADLPDS